MLSLKNSSKPYRAETIRRYIQCVRSQEKGAKSGEVAERGVSVLTKDTDKVQVLMVQTEGKDRSQVEQAPFPNSFSLMLLSHFHTGFAKLL